MQKVPAFMKRKGIKGRRDQISSTLEAAKQEGQCLQVQVVRKDDRLLLAREK